MPHTIALLNKLAQKLQDLIDEPLCLQCDDTGIVPTDVFDPDSGQYMRGVGEMKKCICQIK